jgi:hypothetical protein
MTAPDDPWAHPGTPEPAQLPPQHWPSPPPSTQGTNAWAIVALVCGIFGLFPVAIGAGITALVQISRRHERGSGQAIVGLVLGGLWMLGLATFVAFGLGGAFDYREGSVSRVGVTSVGSCVRLPAGGGPGTPVDCASAHDVEVFGVQPLGNDDDWPGEDAVDDEAYDFCDDGFKPYVGEGYLSSDYDYGYYTPDEREWRAGEHRVVCVILPGFGEDSMRGSARKSP